MTAADEPGAVLAFDLGGTRLKAGVVEAASGEVVESIVTPSSGEVEAALSTLRQVGRRMLRNQGCTATALCVPGLVDDSGTVLALPGKLRGIVGMNLVRWLEDQFSLPALVVNDALAFGMGEVTGGAARDHDRSVVVTIGTGVGVGVFQSGLPISRGPLGGGLLGGQIPILEDPGGPSDTNGKRGTIEARCAAERIVDLARAQGGNFDSVPEVYAAYARRDSAAREGIRAYRRDLARALVALGHAHTPSVIVLGGGPLPSDNPLLPGLQEMVDEQLWPGYEVAVARAVLGEAAALVGLAHWAARGRV